ncbi:dioxygenase [Advenella kashmirensis WT001]|uniref:Dioxygenase n=2 Tax=Advenella kashmirensis TaxID=310575 RepID=I3UDP1_ADVKW|nr:dioxygenase [Advenella kashmirensis WT001]
MTLGEAAFVFIGGHLMSDIAKLAHVSPATTQLPVDVYFNDDIFKKEQARIFDASALYVGHEKLVPESGDWRTLAHEQAGRLLVRNGDNVSLMSNVCRHRQAIMLGGQAGDVTSTTNNHGNLRSSGGNIVCPLHRWTYDNQGTLLGAPQFDSNPCKNLQQFPLQNCNGLLFEGPRNPAVDMAPLFARPEFDFSDYVFDRAIVHECNYNWKTFIEVYLEDYHVAPFHPGLGSFVTCDDLTWDFAETFSLQRVGVHQALANPGSEVYRKWHDELLKFRQGETPDFGAMWVTYFPTHMIELYPHVLVLSTLYPVSPQKTVNLVEFYYPEEIAMFERDFIQAQQAAYMETAIEDDEIAERMDAGRQALYKRGTSETGPYQSPMEDGMQHFHEWYNKLMA